MRFGVQTALSNTTPEELVPLWRRIEELGFGWISVWDHFHAVGGGTRNVEAVSAHTALALATSRVRCGGLVYSVGYRPLAAVANAAAAIDRWSGGRVTLGLGAGYLADEYAAWGLDFPPAGERLDRLEDWIVALRRLFAGEAVTVEGHHVRLRDAVCDPPPIQPALPIWVGGGGERRTLPLAGRLADGWNVPMATVDDFRRKAAVVAGAAADAGRDPAAVERSVGVGLCWDERRLPERFGARHQVLRPAILTGSTDEVLERVAAYRDAGADWLFVSLRAPFDLDEVERFATEIVPALS